MMRMKTRGNQSLKCPSCGSKDIIRILYGLRPLPDPELMSQGKIVLGGCCFTDDDPDYRCGECEHSWQASVEIIVAAAVRNPSGAVFTGPRHVVADAKASENRQPWEFAELARRAGRPEAGFMTSRGRFVDRFKAAKIASRAGQAQAKDPTKGLHSEDFPEGEVPQIFGTAE
jgi:hypothetical protein